MQLFFHVDTLTRELQFSRVCCQVDMSLNCVLRVIDSSSEDEKPPHPSSPSASSWECWWLALLHLSHRGRPTLVQPPFFQSGSCTLSPSPKPLAVVELASLSAARFSSSTDSVPVSPIALGSAVMPVSLSAAWSATSTAGSAPSVQEPSQGLSSVDLSPSLPHLFPPPPLPPMASLPPADLLAPKDCTIPLGSA